MATHDSSHAAADNSARLADFEISVPEHPLTAGSIELDVRNDGPTVHNLSIRDGSGKVLLKTADLNPNATATLAGELKPGSYTAFCSVPGHESLGMKVDLTVEAAH